MKNIHDLANPILFGTLYRILLIIVFPYLGKPNFQIQRGKDSVIGKGLRSAGQACGYRAPTHGLPA